MSSLRTTPKVVAYKDYCWKCPVYTCSNLFELRITIHEDTSKIKNDIICSDCLKSGWRFYPGYLLPLKFNPNKKF